MADLENLSGGEGRQDVDTQDKNGGCYYKSRKEEKINTLEENLQ